MNKKSRSLKKAFTNIPFIADRELMFILNVGGELYSTSTNFKNGKMARHFGMLLLWLQNILIKKKIIRKTILSREMFINKE